MIIIDHKKQCTNHKQQQQTQVIHVKLCVFSIVNDKLMIMINIYAVYFILSLLMFIFFTMFACKCVFIFPSK